MRRLRLAARPLRGLAGRNQLAAPGSFVEQEFRATLRCGVLAHGFLRVHCDACRLDRVVCQKSAYSKRQ
jgi:hypothetical protein